MRNANAIDFWRGFALVTIFINHIPGNVFQQFTFTQFGISDAAELFVFLAGWSIGIATRGREGSPEPAPRTVLRLFSRMVEVYRAQIMITAMALAMIAGAALILDNPLLLEWHNAGLVFGDPIQATLGWVLLLHQLGYFNILPLYVVILGLAPAFVLLARVRLALALAASISLYAASLVFELNLPSWPNEGHWFFNPFCWQLLLVLGFAGFELSHASDRFRGGARRLMPLGILGVSVGALIAVTHWQPDPLRVPEPRLLFTFDKSYLSPARLLHFLCVLLAFQRAFPVLQRALPRFTGVLSSLGRNSLSVFCTASIIALAAQFVRFWTGGGVLIDSVIVSCGVLSLIFTAWFVEWRSRSPRPSLSA